MNTTEPNSLDAKRREGQHKHVSLHTTFTKLSTASVDGTMNFKGSNLPITVKGVSTISLIDTGAMTSFVSLKFVKTLGDIKMSNIESSTKSCALADKTVIPIRGVIKLPVYINKVRYNIRFSILKEMNNDVIIGMDFLQNHGAHLKISPKETKLSFSTIPVYVNCALTLPPQSESIVVGNLS